MYPFNSSFVSISTLAFVPSLGFFPIVPPRYRVYPLFCAVQADDGQLLMQSPQRMHFSASRTKSLSRCSIAWAGQMLTQSLQAMQASLFQPGRTPPMTPMSFSTGLEQLFGQPEIPILNLCGACLRKYAASSSAASSLVSMMPEVQVAAPGQATIPL